MGCFVQNYGNILLVVVLIILILEETKANQLEVAKKYGKRFGNKNKANNNTDTKEITKSVTKVVTDLTKSPSSKSTETTEPTFSRQHTFSKAHTSTTTSTTAPVVPTTQAKTSQEEESEEVDVDLSQLQVSLPNVKFDCGSRVEGYYGDPDYRCEVFHYCNSDGKRDTFLCPSNSKFNQKDMTCDTDAADDLCQSEPAWGQNHMYPTQVSPVLTNVSPIEMNVNKNIKSLRDKVHIEVTAPKYETKDTGFREPVYEIKSLENSRKTTVTNVDTNTENYSKSYTNNNNNNNKEANSDNNRNNNYSNNQSTDNYNKEENINTDSKDIKFNYFGGNFGERQRNPVLSPNTNTNTKANTGANDRKNIQNNYNNNYNPNPNNYNTNSKANNGNSNTHLLVSSDFGTVTDANRKGYKEENGNNKPVISHSHSTTDSNHYTYSPTVKQSFTPNDYQMLSFDNRLNKPNLNSDSNTERTKQNLNINTNTNKNSFEIIHSEPYIPSSAPDKAYLSAPTPTERPSSAAPQKSFASGRHKTYEVPPVRQLAPAVNARPAVKWPERKQTGDSFVYELEKGRTEPMPTTTFQPPTTTSPTRRYRPPVEEYKQKQIIKSQNQSPHHIYVDTHAWTQTEPKDNYEPTKYSMSSIVAQPMTTVKLQVQAQEAPAQAQQQQGPKLQIDQHSENGHKNWSPFKQSPNTYGQQNQLKPKTITAPVHKPWNENSEIRKQPQPQQEQQVFQQQPDPEHYFFNKDSTFTYPAVHHTIVQPMADNHLWSNDKTVQQKEAQIEYKPKSTQSLKPKWAQEMSESMDELPHSYQTITTHTQQLIPQSSQPQRTENYSFSHKNKDMSEQNNSGRRQNPNRQIDHSNDFGFNYNSLFDMKVGQAISDQPNFRHPASQMNLFYDHFQPLNYKFAENSPTEYIKKLSETEKQIIKESLFKDEMQNKDIVNTNTKTNVNNQNQKRNKNTIIPNNNNEQVFKTHSIVPDFKPSIIDDIKYEKDIFNSRLNGYVPEILPEDDFPITFPETHIIPKIYKNVPKPKIPLKLNTNRYKPNKQFMTTSNLFDEIMAGETGWSTGGSGGLETAFSHNYPIEHTFPFNQYNRRVPKTPKFPKPSYSTPMVSHMAAPSHRPNHLMYPNTMTQVRQPPPHIPQPAFYYPPQMPFVHQLQAQPSIPFPYYVPYYPTQPKSYKPSKKPTKRGRNQPKIIKF